MDPTISALIRAARAAWNEQADRWNQWDALGQDEKDELIDAYRAAHPEAGRDGE